MSRRKQSNPKPIKSGEEDAGENQDLGIEGLEAKEGIGLIEQDASYPTNHCNGTEQAKTTDQSEESDEFERDTRENRPKLRNPSNGYDISEQGILGDESERESPSCISSKTNSNNHISIFVVKGNDETIDRDASPGLKLTSINADERLSRTYGTGDDESNDQFTVKSEPLSVSPFRDIKEERAPQLDSKHIMLSAATTTCHAAINHTTSHAALSINTALTRSNLRRSRSRSLSRSDNGNDAAAVLSPESTKTKMKLARHEAELSLVNHLQLPNDVLYLKQQDMNIHGTPSVGWVVCCAIPLPQGSSLGPFQGQLVSSEDVKVGDLIVQLTNKRGQQALLNVAGKSGGWLALLRTPGQGGDRNTQVYWEGGRIWCEIVSDIEVGEELRATFSFQNEEENEEEVTDDTVDESSDIDVGGSDNNIPDILVSPAAAVAETAPQTQPQQQQQQQAPAPGHAALLYGCPFCGVRFSSPRTLQGHLSFYCSKKTSDLIVNPTGKDGTKRTNPENCLQEAPYLKREPNDDEERSASTPRASDHSSTSGLHSPTTGEMKCQQCPYTCDKMTSLNRHMRIHNTSRSPTLPAQTSNASILADKRNNGIANHKKETTNSVIKTSSADTFCNECRIQFSSLRTYQCHKEHYCAQRRNRGESREVASHDTSPFAAMFYPRILFPEKMSKVGIPSALQMAAMSRGGLIMPGHSTLLSPSFDISTSTNGAASAAVAAAAASMFLGAPVLASSLGLAPILSTADQTTPSATASPSNNSDDTGTNAKISTNKESQSVFHPASVTSSSNSPLSSPSSSIPRNHYLMPSRRHRRSKTPESKQTENKFDSLQNLRNAEGELEVRNDRNIESDDKGDDLPLDLTKPKQSTSPASSKQHKDRLRQSSFSEKSRSIDGFLERNSNTTSPSLSPHQQTYPPSSPYKGTSLSPSSVKIESDSQSPKTFPITSQTASRSEYPTSGVAVQLFPQNPSVIISPGQLISGLSPVPISPTSKMAMSASPSTMSKCTDCNIVFYKLDNYLVHKRHYCSGKRRAPVVSTATTLAQKISDSLAEATLSNSNENCGHHSPPSNRNDFKIKDEYSSMQSHTIEKSPSPRANPPSSTFPRPKSPRDTTTDNIPGSGTNVPADVRYKFYCVPCRIKFSNVSILNAHKEYYCPSGKHSEQSIVMQSPGTDVTLSTEDNQQDSPESSPEEFGCSRCNTVFTSSRLLRLHVCNGGFPCPHCDHVAITENRRAEHLKVHAPTRAFRCTICGYRGNTFRGMRMHGKTHIDEGLDFTDENMLEYHEPALVPVIPTEPLDSGTDSELLRIKNEPYKRRRSRKAYEKFDFPLPKVDVPQSCPLCGQTFVNSDFLSSHFKVHEIAASQYLAGLMKCIHCEYVGKSANDLRSHFEINHTRQSRKRERSSPSHPDDEETGTSRQSPHSSRDFDSPQRKRMVITDPNSPEDDKEALRFLVDSNNIRPRTASPHQERQNSSIVDERSEEPTHSNESEKKRKHYISRSPSPEFSRQVNHFLYAPGHDNKLSPKRGDSPVDINMSSKSNNTLSFFNTRSPNSSQNMSPQQTLNRTSPLTETLHPEILPNRRLSAGHEHNMDTTGKDVLPQHRERSRSQNETQHQRQPSAEKDHSSISATKADHEPDSTTAIKHEPLSPSPVGPDQSHVSAPRSPEPASAPITLSPVIPEGLVLPPNDIIFPNPYRHAFPYMFLSPPVMSASLPSTSSSSQESRSAGAGGSHYCQYCDISFSKQATYLAHKKYYCNGAARVPHGKSSAQA